MVGFGQGKKASHDRATRPTFSEIVGQPQLKQALLAVGANKALDGLLIQGEKGAAKSTAVRALAGHLPTQQVVADCPYGCHPTDSERQCGECRARAELPTAEQPVPLVTLPLGATRERVVGTLSVADALAGEAEFDPGLLARANRGILYVDEINLLDDHLVDLLLDAAASGRNTVERDGVSISHPADFTLIGTMNPEEGELRPQLRDRFALQATVTGCTELDQRVEIIDRAIDKESEGTPAVGGQKADAATRLQQVRERLAAVTLPEEFTREIAKLCRDAGVDGHRGDIATARAARTFAALDERSKVIEGDVRRAAELALPHRLQSKPFEESPDPEELLDDHFEDDESADGQPDDSGDDQPDSTDSHGEGDDENATDSGERGSDASSDTETDCEDDREQSGQPQTAGAQETAGSSERGDANDDGEQGEDDDGNDEQGDSDEQAEEAPLVPGQPRAEIGDASTPDLADPDTVEEATGSGRRLQARPSVDSEGPTVRSVRAASASGIDAAASVRAAAQRGESSVQSRDLRQSVRENETGTLVVFAVDASASMRQAMRAAKGTVLELLKDAYQQRDQVAFVTFAGEDADVLLPPTDSVTRAARHLKELPTGDRTPLPDGLHTAGAVLDRASPDAGVVVLVTDGKANVATGSPIGETRNAAKSLTDLGAHVVVIDAGDGDDTGVVDVITEETSGQRLGLSALSAERIDTAIGTAWESQI